MPTPQIQNDPIINFPNLYKDGMLISFLTTTTLGISAGACRDSNNVIDITLGQPNVENEPQAASLILNSAINGANGLDEGDLAADSMYAIYVIADSRYYLPTACIATLESNAAPLIPLGYDSYRLIGYWSTAAGSAVFNFGFYSGRGNEIKFYYDAQQTFLTAGNSTSPQTVSLENIVPKIADVNVGIQAVYTATTAGHVNNWYNGSGSGTNYVLILAQVAAVPISEQLELCTGPLVTGLPTVKYAV